MERQKIIFPQLTDSGEIEQESIWCIKKGQDYIIDNIPFIAKRISLGDTIRAEYDAAEDTYYFDDFIDVSGNTTVRIYFYDRPLIERVRLSLSAFGCETEAFLERNLIAVNVPKEVDYRPIKSFLDEGEASQNWTYEESCLAHA